jgi:hypothetical protein
MVDFNKEVVQSIAPPKPIAWFTGRPHDGTVVVPVSGLFTPGGGLCNAPGRQQAARAREPIRAPPQSQRPKPALRRAAVALAFIGFNAAPAERGRQDQRSCAKQAFRSSPRPRPNRNIAKKYSAHSVHLPGKQIPNCRLRLYPAMYYFAPGSRNRFAPTGIASLTDKAAGVFVDAEHA